MTHDRCEGTSSPLSPGWRRLMDKDALSNGRTAAASASDLRRRCSVGAHPNHAGWTVIKSRCAIRRLFFLSPSCCCSGKTDRSSQCLRHDRHNGEVVLKTFKGQRCQKFHFDCVYSGCVCVHMCVCVWGVGLTQPERMYLLSCEINGPRQMASCFLTIYSLTLTNVLAAPPRLTLHR